MITRDELNTKLKPFLEGGLSHSVDVGDGWLQIVDDLHACIIKVCPEYHIEQIKEKFGGLRYYVRLPEDKAIFMPVVQGLIEVAENKSFDTCEVCGEPGEPVSRKSGWVKTVCPLHAE